MVPRTFAWNLFNYDSVFLLDRIGRWLLVVDHWSFALADDH